MWQLCKIWTCESPEVTLRGWRGYNWAFNKQTNNCLSVCLSVCLCASRKRFLRHDWSHHHQTWHGDCISYENASRIKCFDLLFTQGHIYFNHEIIKCFIIGETVQAMPIRFAVKIDSPTKGLHNRCPYDDLVFHSRSQLSLKRDTGLTCSSIVIYRTNINFKLWHSNLAWR